MSNYICDVCNDTHQMPLGDRTVMCTRCPTPCDDCRTGAFCRSTPCDCRCHTSDWAVPPEPASVTIAQLRAQLAAHAEDWLGTVEDRLHAEDGDVDEFDPWHALRNHGAELAKHAAIVAAAKAWRLAYSSEFDADGARAVRKASIALRTAIDAAGKP